MMTNDQIIERFEREYQAFHSISTVRRRQQCKMIRTLGDQIAPRGLMETDARDLIEFMSRLLDAGQHVNTVRKKANMLRSFFSWAYAAELYTAERYLRLKTAKDPRGASGRSLPNPYTPAEIAEFYRQLDARFAVPEIKNMDRHIQRWVQGKVRFAPRLLRHAMRLQIEAIVALALHLGLRREEIYRLSLVDMHYDNEYVVVHGARKNAQGEIVVHDQPYNEAAREAVRAWLDFRTLMRPEHGCPWLGLTAARGTHAAHGENRARAMSFDTFGLLLSTYVGDWSLQRFRHTCGTERLRSGMPLEKVSKFLRHTDIQQTLGYAEIVKSDIHRDMQRTDEEFVRRVGRRAA